MSARYRKQCWLVALCIDLQKALVRRLHQPVRRLIKLRLDLLHTFFDTFCTRIQKIEVYAGRLKCTTNRAWSSVTYWDCMRDSFRFFDCLRTGDLIPIASNAMALACTVFLQKPLDAVIKLGSFRIALPC